MRRFLLSNKLATSILLFVSLFFVGNFFYGQDVQAQFGKQQPTRPDFKITTATFDGRNLHVEYINATGIGYPKIRYEVGFQWYDASGSALGARHWLPVPAVERGGVSILDNKYRIDLTYQGRDGRNYGRTLAEFLYQRPDKAEELQVMVDDGDRVSETDESNNIARLRIPLPDLQITGAKFLSPNKLELSYRNANPAPIPVAFRIGFTWAEESGRALSFTRFMNVLEPASGTTKTEILSRTDVSYVNDQGRQVGDRLDWYFERRPGNATRLKITIDDAGTVREANEQNNLVSVRPDLPDLVVREARLVDGQLSLVYGNAGEGYIRDLASRLVFQWRNASDQPVGSQRWYGFAQMDPQQMFTVNAERFDVEYAVSGTNRTTTQRLSTYVREQPAGATRLDIIIDDEQRILEANENNNTATITPPPPPPPDLAISDARLTADALTFTARNIGPGSVPAGQFISFWFEWVNQAGGRVAALAWNDVQIAFAPGQFLNFDASRAQFRRERPRDAFSDPVTFSELMASAPKDATHLKIRVDGPNTYIEPDEKNNILLLPKPIPPQPDLAISDLRVNPGNVITFGVQNLGDAATGSAVSLWFHRTTAGGVQVGPLYWYDVPEISAGQTQPFNSADITVHSEAGDALLSAVFADSSNREATHFKILLDGSGRIQEKNEGNNTALLLKPVQPKPDLTFTRVTVVHEAPDPMIEYVMSNIGAADTVDGLLGLQWLTRDGRPTGNAHEFVAFGLLRAGEETGKWQLLLQDSGPKPGQTGRFLITPPADATHLRLTLDPQNVIAESDETNNTVVVERPTIILSDLVITDASLTRDGLTFTYKNIGPVRGGLQPTMSLWFEWVDGNGARVGSEFAWLDVKALPAKYFDKIESRLIRVRHETRGEIALDEFLAGVPSGATHLKVRVDGPNIILESNEENNVVLLSKPAASKLPDLALTAVTRVGGVVKVMIVNDTTNTITTPLLQFKWLDAKGNALGTSPVSYWSGANIAPGKTGEFAIEYEKWREDGVIYFLKHPPAGTVALLTTIDPENKLKELNEDNNFFKITFGQPDLTVSTAEVINNTLRIEVKNVGGESSKDTDIWLMWFGAKGALQSSGAVNLPAIVAGSSTLVSVPFVGDAEVNRILREPPAEATRLRVFLDGSRKVEELNENNNDTLIDRDEFPKKTSPSNKPPIADAGEDIVARDDDNDGIEIVRFYSRNSSDPDGKIVSWSWTLNGQEIANGQYPYWRNAPVGTHAVTLTVKDDKGATATDNVIVKIEGPPASPPDLIIDSLELIPAEPKPGETVFFTVRAKNIGLVSADGNWMNLNIDLGNNKSIDVQLAQPALKSLASGESQTWNWNDKSNQYYYWKAIEGTHLIRSCADTAGFVKESDERNNCLEKIITVGIPVVKPPDLSLILSVETISPTSSAGAAAGSVATGGLFLALLTFLGGGLLIYAHNGTPGTLRDFFGVYPLVFASPEDSYMRLQECGPEGCRGKHFAQHRALKYLTKGSLVAAVSAGALKLVIATALATLIPASQALLAEGKEVYSSDKLRATLIVKNVGQSKATDVVLTLPCPAGTIWASTTLNSAVDNRNADNGLPSADLEAGKSHQLAIVCQVKDSAATSQQKLKFVGTASAKGAERVFQSNAVELQARPRPEPEKPIEPEILPDLTVEGLGIVSEKVVEGANRPFKATFTGVVQNHGDKPVLASRARLKIDIGANGKWDDLGVGLFDVPALDPDGTAVAKWDVSWNTPLGLYAFEVCADADNKVKESNEKNNCLNDRFTLQKGEEPMFEESEDLLE